VSSDEIKELQRQIERVRTDKELREQELMVAYAASGSTQARTAQEKLIEMLNLQRHDLTKAYAAFEHQRKAGQDKCDEEERSISNELRRAQQEILAARATELENTAVRPEGVTLGTQTEKNTKSLGTQTLIDQQTQTTADVGTLTTTGTGTSPSRAGALEKEKSDLQRQNDSLRGDVARV
jgi:hypothetical protein